MSRNAREDGIIICRHALFPKIFCLASIITKVLFSTIFGALQKSFNRCSNGCWRNSRGREELQRWNHFSVVGETTDIHLLQLALHHWGHHERGYHGFDMLTS